MRTATCRSIIDETYRAVGPLQQGEQRVEIVTDTALSYTEALSYTDRASGNGQPVAC